MFATAYGRRWVRLAAKKGDDGKRRRASGRRDAGFSSSEGGEGEARGLGFYAVGTRLGPSRIAQGSSRGGLSWVVRETWQRIPQRIDDDRLEAVVKIVRMVEAGKLNPVRLAMPSSRQCGSYSGATPCPAPYQKNTSASLRRIANCFGSGQVQTYNGVPGLYVPADLFNNQPGGPRPETPLQANL